MSNKETFMIEMIQSFANFKRGDQLEVSLDPTLNKVYVAHINGAPQYIPKISAKEIKEPQTFEELLESAAAGDSGVSSNQRTTVFDSSSPAPPSSTEGQAHWSDEEQEVLSRLIGDKPLPKPADDGPVTKTSFEADKSLTVAEKARKMMEAKVVEIRAKLKEHETSILQEGQFWLSDLTEGELPTSGIDRVITCHIMTHWMKSDADGKWYLQIDKSNPWFEGMESADVPEVDMNYTWQANVLECLVLGDLMNERSLFTGPPGTGKTTAVKQYAAWTDHPYMKFNGKDGIEQSSFLGFNTLTGGEMFWKDGLLPQGLKGGYIICIDEVFKIPAGIQMALQSLYERGGTLLLDEKAGSLFEKTVIPTKDARIFLTDNVKGTGEMSEMFSATQTQDSSTLDRFGLTVDVNYLPERAECKMLNKVFPNAKHHVIKKLVQFANMVRDAYLDGKISLTMSPRGLLSCLEMIELFQMPERSALALSFINKIGDDTEKQVIKQFLRTVY